MRTSTSVNGFLLGTVLAFGTVPGYLTAFAELLPAQVAAVESTAMHYAINTLRHVARLQRKGMCNEHCC
ncbi:MAG: hypothetical protein WD081_06420 [Gammaproteobacteria bacterium]